MDEETSPPLPPDDAPEPEETPQPPAEPDSEEAGPSNLLQEAPEQAKMTEAEEQSLLKVRRMRKQKSKTWLSTCAVWRLLHICCNSHEKVTYGLHQNR